jgi:hypothetical protein
MEETMKITNVEFINYKSSHSWLAISRFDKAEIYLINTPARLNRAMQLLVAWARRNPLTESEAA